MNTEHLHTQLSPTDFAAFREAAKRGALKARQEMQDQFWATLGGGLMTGSRALWSTLSQARRVAFGRVSHRTGYGCKALGGAHATDAGSRTLGQSVVASSPKA